MSSPLHAPPPGPTGFFLNDLGGRTPDEKRESLFRTLCAHGWPDGYEGFMRAINEPQAVRKGGMRAKPGRRLDSVSERPSCEEKEEVGGEGHVEAEAEGNEDGSGRSMKESGQGQARPSSAPAPGFGRATAPQMEGPTAVASPTLAKLERSIEDLNAAMQQQAKAIRHLSPPRHARARGRHAVSPDDGAIDSEEDQLARHRRPQSARTSKEGAQRTPKVSSTDADFTPYVATVPVSCDMSHAHLALHVTSATRVRGHAHSFALSFHSRG